MSDISQIWSADLFRRSLLQGVASVAGAATIVSVTASRAKAAKVAKQTVAYQDTRKTHSNVMVALFLIPRMHAEPVPEICTGR